MTLAVPIGDDAALISASVKTDWVVSCDSFIEGVHFWANLHPPEAVGYKSLVRATSDLAAMGAEPEFFLLTLALPAAKTGAWLDGLLKGMGRAARKLRIVLAGGDTTKSETIFLSITVLGKISPRLAVTRAGARPGDLIYVSGRLGRAQLGLDLMRQGLGAKRRLAVFLQPHLYPTIRIELGSWLAQKSVASSMMDISDGLSTDLSRLCSASGVGARINASNIPCVEIPVAVRQELPRRHFDAMAMALHGGEDYELLFTVPPRKVRQLRKAPGFPEMKAIGEVTRKKAVVLVGSNGRQQSLRPLGWDPFRKR